MLSDNFNECLNSIQVNLPETIGNIHLSQSLFVNIYLWLLCRLKIWVSKNIILLQLPANSYYRIITVVLNMIGRLDNSKYFISKHDFTMLCLMPHFRKEQKHGRRRCIVKKLVSRARGPARGPIKRKRIAVFTILALSS